MDYIVVLDQGSSSSRAFAFSASGEKVFSARRNFAPVYGGGRVEYDSRALIREQVSALDEILDRIPAGSRILSMAVAAQRSTFLAWDKKNGEPLTPVISWQDGRTAGSLDEVKISQDRIHEITGLYKTPYYSASKMAWCVKNYSRVKKAAKEKRLLMGPVSSWLLWRLSGGKINAVDPTQAQRTLLFNIKTGKWDAELPEKFGLSASVLPEIYPTEGYWGEIERRGFKFPVLVSSGDQQAAFRGLGLSRKTALANYGTGAFLLVNTGRKRLKISGILNSVGPVNGFKNNNFDYYAESTVNSCSTLFEWLGRNFGFFSDLNEIENLCASSKNRILFLSAIGGIGSPYWDYSTFTTLSGLTAETNKADIIRAAVESVAYMIADPLELISSRGVKPEFIIAAGGLSRINHLLQFQADLTGLKVVRSREKEVTALGAAKLAASACGLRGTLWEKNFFSEEFHPSTTRTERKKMLGLWREFIKSSRSLSAKMRKSGLFRP